MLIILQIGIVILADKMVTNKKTFLTRIGINSMAVYLLHLFIVLPLNYIIKLLDVSDPLIQLICTLALTAIVVFILSRDFITKYLNKFTDSCYSILFKLVDSLFTVK